MILATKRYLLIKRADGNQFSVEEFNSLEEAVLAERYTDDFYIAEAVNDITVYGRFEKPKAPENDGKEN